MNDLLDLSYREDDIYNVMLEIHLTIGSFQNLVKEQQKQQTSFKIHNINLQKSIVGTITK